MTLPIDYQRLFNAVDEPLVAIDERCRIIAYNHAAERLAGYTVAEVLDRPCTLLFPPEEGRHVCLCDASEPSGSPKAKRVALRRRNGTNIPVSLTAAPLVDSAGRTVGTIETIHAHPDDMGALLARESTHRESILASLTEGVVTIDREWRVSAMNAAAQRMLGRRAADSIGQPCTHVLACEACTERCPVARMLEQETPVEDERLRLTRRDGTTVDVSLNVAILRGEDGDALGGVLSFREIGQAASADPASPPRNFHGMVAASPVMRQLFTIIEEVATSDATVLITGETGSGKELVAEAIQQQSERRTGPFVRVNCTVFSEGVLESELFGHAKGAFTGAVSHHRGRFALAHTGTLFLDEIGDVHPRVQVKLLRVLQDQRVEPVGGEASIDVDVRIIAATNRDLSQLVRRGQFREDLYYRLNVIPIHVPPLRARPDDIPLLVEHFLVNRPGGRRFEGVDERAMHVLRAFAWPGNVRQLQNAIEYAHVRTHGPRLTPDLLPAEVRAGARAQASERFGADAAADILAALNAARWNHGRAARALGVSRTTLWRRMKRLGLTDP